MDAFPEPLAPDAIVMINWGRFDEIGALPVRTLAAHFDDPWRPAADDIDVFTEELSWVVSVRHFGRSSG